LSDPTAGLRLLAGDMPTHTIQRGRVFAERVLERVNKLGLHLRPFKPRKPREQVEVVAPKNELVAAYRKFAKLCSMFAILVGYHVLLGWLFEIPVLTRPWAGLAPMQMSAAVCAVLAGMALLLLQMEQPNGMPRKMLLVRVLAGLTQFIAAVSVLEHLFGWNFGVDHLVSSATLKAGNGGHASTSVTSALAFFVLGGGIMSIDLPRLQRLTEALAVISGATALLAIAGYLYEASPFGGQMPLYAAVVVFFLAAGILFVRVDRGVMAKVASNSFGGIMARRLLPATLLIPMLLGWMQHLGQVEGLYRAGPGLAFFSVANVLAFVVVVWWGVNSLHRMDTKRRLAEQELQQTAAKLSRSNADLEQFAYVASHDLKEPLRAISGSVQVLQERYGPELGEEADEVIKHTVDGANRMQRLIEDLLTYSRLTTREEAMEPTDTGKVLDLAIENLELSIKESKAIITRDPMPTVKVDGTQLLQVFQNLISNGLKYRSERTPKIHVGCDESDAEWVFSVRDNGIGIAPQYADRIFRIFQRLHTRREYPGTGIGLAVCKKVVERHGGRVWVESELEEGSTFFFTLPKD
jgi:signal transduction histidine kinase